MRLDVSPPIKPIFILYSSWRLWLWNNSTIEIQDTSKVSAPSGARAIGIQQNSAAILSNNPTINFTANLSDVNGIDNATLYIYYNNGTLFNSTTVAIGGVLTYSVGIIVNMVDGLFDCIHARRYACKHINVHANFNINTNNNSSMDINVISLKENLDLSLSADLHVDIYNAIYKGDW